MGLFNKKKEEVKDMPKKTMSSAMPYPTLPEIPKLPDFPGMDEEENNDYSDEPLPQLPSFPNNSLGDKFSQNTIKEAVAGEKRGNLGMNADNFSPDEEDESDENWMKQESPDMNPFKGMQKGIMPPERKMEQQPPRMHQSYSKQYTSEKKAEPVFIRLDKFEESLKVFEETKEQISEVEHLLANIKEVKEKEEAELSSWENKLQEIKRQVEKVDQDIFSKI